MTDNTPPTARKKGMKKILRWIKIIAFIYAVVGMGLYFFQDRIFLHPESLTGPYSFSVPFKEVDIPISHYENFNIVQFLPKDSLKKGVVLYFHGNRQNILHYAKFADNFTRLGYEVWMPDYPGFGKTTGVLTEKKLYEEALLVYKLANLKYKADSILLYGRSFGTGIASQLASVRDCRRLILETPYFSIPALFGYYAPIYPTEFMAKLKLPVNEYIKEVTAPVSIFHGTDDEVIPYSTTEKLKSFLKPGDEFITIQKGKHNNLNDFALFHRKLDSLLLH